MSRNGYVVAFLVCFALRFVPAAGAEESAPAEEPLNVFEGRVVDASGNPVAEATVHAFHAEESNVWYHGPEDVYVHAPSEKAWLLFPKRNGLRASAVTTDQDGHFIAYGLKPGPYRVLVIHPERGAMVSSRLSQPNPGSPATLTLGPPTFLKGQLKGLDAAPHQEAPLYSRLWQDYQDRGVDSELFLTFRMFPNVTVQGDGTFAVGPLPSGGDFTFRLARFVRARNFAADLIERQITVDEGKTTSLVIDLTQGTKLNGRIIGPEGKPLDWVAVTIRPPEDAKDPPWTTLGDLTDAEGRFTLAGLSPGTYRLAANRWAPRTGPG